MDNITQLFIRACKTNDPFKRLCSVYRRFYLGTDYSELQMKVILSNLLSEVVDYHCPMTMQKMFLELNQYYYKDYELGERLYYIMVNHIRFNVNKTSHPALRTPRRFKGE